MMSDAPEPRTFDPEMADEADVDAWIELGLIELHLHSENAWRLLAWQREQGEQP